MRKSYAITYLGRLLSMKGTLNKIQDLSYPIIMIFCQGKRGISTINFKIRML